MSGGGVRSRRCFCRDPGDRPCGGSEIKLTDSDGGGLGRTARGQQQQHDEKARLGAESIDGAPELAQLVIGEDAIARPRRRGDGLQALPRQRMRGNPGVSLGVRQERRCASVDSGCDRRRAALADRVDHLDPIGARGLGQDAVAEHWDDLDIADAAGVVLVSVRPPGRFRLAPFGQPRPDLWQAGAGYACCLLGLLLGDRISTIVDADDHRFGASAGVGKSEFRIGAECDAGAFAVIGAGAGGPCEGAAGSNAQQQAGLARVPDFQPVSGGRFQYPEECVGKLSLQCGSPNLAGCWGSVSRVRGSIGGPTSA